MGKCVESMSKCFGNALSSRHEAILGSAKQTNLKGTGSPVQNTSCFTFIKVTKMAQINRFISGLFEHSATHHYEQASSSSLKSLKPNMFIDMFEMLLGSISQVFQLEITHKWGVFSVKALWQQIRLFKQGPGGDVAVWKSKSQPPPTLEMFLLAPTCNWLFR